LVTVLGGKITTYRLLAEHAMSLLRPYFPGLGMDWTASAPLPGGEIPDADFDRFLVSLRRDRPWLPATLAHRLARAYGARVGDLLGDAKALDDLGHDFGAGLTLREVEYLTRNDMEELEISVSILESETIDGHRVVTKAIRENAFQMKGGLRFVKALGFEIKERNQVQVSMNLVNYVKSPVFRVFEMIKSEAERYGVAVTSSEIVGLVPQSALADVAEFYLRLENFTPDQILENRLKSVTSESMGAAGDDFSSDVASASPAPGGGSVAAAAGALGAALAGMVCKLTVKKKKYAEVRDELLQASARADELRLRLNGLVIKDKEAFDAVMDAFALPKGNDKQISARNQAIAESSKSATHVPMEVVSASLEALRLARTVAEKGNANSITDAGVGALMARAAIEGAAYNARINLVGLEDEKFKKEINDRLSTILPEADKLALEVKELVEIALVQ
ncbi:MAG: cyclodeaminase/cyclohydrolase family protein, partial [candidate division Zixibacteria bacterium]|nr:cyclodeaminase/cyclohydrolase family protein [candidate division Zixibacteria bacterium]